MLKKAFGLASVTVLSGLVVAVSASGCSSTQTYVYVDDGGVQGSKVVPDPPASRDGGATPDSSTSPDGSTDLDSSTKTDGSKPKPDAQPPGICPTTDPITAADIDAQLQWKPPAAFVNVCTQQNIDALKNLFKAAPAGGVKYADIKTALGATCAGCAFSPLAGAKWQVFVEDVGGAIDNRTGSCFAQRSGTSCGLARFRWETCLDEACPETDCGAAGVQACTVKAQSGACQTLTTAYASACPNEATDLPICGNIFGAIAVTCSGGPGNTIDVN